MTKSSGAKIERFAYIVSFKKCNFWSLSAVTGFGVPEAPEGSAFLLVVPRADEKLEPSDGGTIEI